MLRHQHCHSLQSCMTMYVWGRESTLSGRLPTGRLRKVRRFGSSQVLGLCQAEEGLQELIPASSGVLVCSVQCTGSRLAAAPAWICKFGFQVSLLAAGHPGFLFTLVAGVSKLRSKSALAVRMERAAKLDGVLDFQPRVSHRGPPLFPKRGEKGTQVFLLSDEN